MTTGDVKVWTISARAACRQRKQQCLLLCLPSQPTIIVSGSEDGTVKIWNSGTYRIEITLSYALERAWCVGLCKDANEIAVQ